MDVAEWLRDLGLGRYAVAFRDNEIDGAALPKLTAEDLTDLGVVLGSHRRKLLEAIAALSSPLANPPPPAGEGRVGAERRQLTVMFCDLVGCTALSARLDPEDLREVIGAYHAAIAKVIGRFDGFVAKYMGDGFWPISGIPKRTRTMPSVQYGPASLWFERCADCKRRCRCRCAWVSQPDSWSSVT